MDQNLLSRETVIAVAGLQKVMEAEHYHADFGFIANPKDSIHGEMEFTASITFDDPEGYERRLQVVYYQPSVLATTAEDLSDLDWVIAGYRIF